MCIRDSNYLLPQGLAMLVTPGNLKAFELERKKLQARMDALRAAADDIAGKLEGLVLPIVMRVGDNDKLYGSVTTAIIGDALTAQGIEVDRRRILLDHPIRTLGDHPVRVRLHADEMCIRDSAYPVRKQMRGYFVRLEYVAPGDTVAELERIIRISDGAFKFLTCLLYTSRCV